MDGCNHSGASGFGLDAYQNKLERPPVSEGGAASPPMKPSRAQRIVIYQPVSEAVVEVITLPVP